MAPKLPYRLSGKVPMPHRRMPDDMWEAMDAFACHRTWKQVEMVIKAVHRKDSKARIRSILCSLMWEAGDLSYPFDTASIFEEAFPAWAKFRKQVDTAATKKGFKHGYHEYTTDIMGRGA